LFAADKALELAQRGLPFRDAYKVISESKFDFVVDAVKNIEGKRHLGATGNLGLRKLRERIAEQKRKVQKEKNAFEKKMGAVLRL
jgi:argininosuccinate lyase